MDFLLILDPPPSNTHQCFLLVPFYHMCTHVTLINWRQTYLCPSTWIHSNWIVPWKESHINQSRRWNLLLKYYDVSQLIISKPSLLLPTQFSQFSKEAGSRDAVCYLFTHPYPKSPLILPYTEGPSLFISHLASYSLSLEATDALDSLN